MTPARAERTAKPGSARAAALALDVDVDVLGAVPLDVGPLARVRLSGEHKPKFANVAKAQVPPLLEALVLASGAETEVKDQLRSKASSRVATVKLKLLGELLVKVLKSECNVTRDTVEVSSDVVFADGSVLGIAVDMVGLQARPNSRVSIPAVGTLILNEQKIQKRMSSRSGRVEVTVNALRLELNGILGTGDVVIGQSVCKLRGAGVGKDLKITSTTNGADTSG
ncbi:MAG TPA: choice-of-anchor P family protein, partial [Acidimicrobiia bacterium]|nr:choice-of-anchor P family protein [Acidimicrobiia bacterium]